MISALTDILTQYRAISQTEREKGTYFEELIRTYFRFEPSYADLYSDVWLYADWAKEIGTPQYKLSAKDTGIDLVAKTRGTDEYHAIQCKCYDADHRISKADIDSFFAASGPAMLQLPFADWLLKSTSQPSISENEEKLRIAIEALTAERYLGVVY
jgi:predicted helicase